LQALARVTPSPAIELNRAVAPGMAFGPETGLRHVDALVTEPSLRADHLLPSVRADLLTKLGRRAELERAAVLTADARERDLLPAPAAALGRP
jgi:RNA polymerase sigma-70 factor (ECF subfamily)